MAEDDGTIKKRLIVIGGGVSGMNVIFELIKLKTNEQFEITCITKESKFDYSTCGLPFVIEGITKFDEIILHTPAFFNENNVTILNNTEVVVIDFDKDQIRFKEIGSGNNQEQILSYDYLVLATGRSPFKPPIPGIDLNGVFTFLNYQEADEVFQAISGKENAVIIGGGIIGLEMAVAFNERNINTIVVELAPGVLPTMLDPEQSNIVEDWLQNKGIKIIKNTKVESIQGSNKVEGITLSDKQVLSANFVLLSAGIRPNIALASSSGLELGAAGGIRTDSKQHVILNGNPLTNVFALGDCVETENLLTGQPMICAIASNALIQAKVVAKNILSQPSEMRGSVNPTVTMLAGLQIGSVGLTSHSANKAGISFKSATGFGKSNSRFIPGWKDIHFKFLAQGDKLIGAQIIGETDVKERINMLALVIREGINIPTLLETERCYAPPLGLLSDPMLNVLSQLI